VGLWHLLEAARRDGARLLQASTSEVYGDPQVHPQREDYWGHVNPVGPRSCYDEGKRCAETLFMDYHRQHRLPIKIARIFNTYGPRMHPADGRVVSNFIVQALKGEPITIFGDGQQTRAFCFVDDTVEALLRLMASPPDFTGPVNVGNPQELSMLGIARLVLELTGSRSRLEFHPRPADDPCRRCPDIALAQRMLDWEPTVALRDGLTRTIAYFEDVLKAPLAKCG
jgi:UDP-glucuronate decarboxylase